MSSLKDYAIAGTGALALLFLMPLLMPLLKLLVLVDEWMTENGKASDGSENNSEAD